MIWPNVAVELDACVRGLESADAFSGVVLLARDGVLVSHEAYGLANRADGLANTPATRFGTASVTKMFTAAAIARLVADGRARFDTRVTDYLPELTDRFPGVTLHHLLTHTSGIGDYFDENDPDCGDYADLWRVVPMYRMRRPADFLPLFADKPATQVPGARFRYSNAGYILLGQVIEHVAGCTYPDFVTQHVFAPAGMARSGSSRWTR